MNYEERLQNVTVLGASGKMGAGILLLTAVEMAGLSLKPENKGKSFVLNALGVREEALTAAKQYVHSQVLKMAEKKALLLRSVYADRTDLSEDYEILAEYVRDVMDLVHPTTQIETAYNSTLIFEAVTEDPEKKVTLLSNIAKNNPNKPWFLSNTSSIPITELDEKAGLEGRIIGFHLYNPPAIQKLVEVIRSKHTLEELGDFALAYAKNLKKVVVPSHDVSGFIGNGHFMREILLATGEVERLEKDFGYVESVYAVNKISQDYLIRPMGIFQLIDYAGIDVCSHVLSVMSRYGKAEELCSALLDRMLELGIKGGQYADGSQKEGFLKYEKGKPEAAYSPDKKAYIPFSDFHISVDCKLGEMPSVKPWKEVIGCANKEELLVSYFGELKTLNSPAAELAKAYAKRSREIGKQLVANGVAYNEQDVNTVLLTGFFHAYGPINNYLS
jgi:3-hydroxyacyl-CoA dehydrogenase